MTSMINGVHKIKQQITDLEKYTIYSNTACSSGRWLTTTKSFLGSSKCWNLGLACMFQTQTHCMSQN